MRTGALLVARGDRGDHPCVPRGGWIAFPHSPRRLSRALSSLYVSQRQAPTRAAWRVRGHDLAAFLEWPHGIARLGVILCVAVSVVFGPVYLWHAVGRLGDDAGRNANLNIDDREFAGGNSLVVDKRALYEARAQIPENGTYRVVAGPGVEGATELTEPYIDQFARSFLMPRRPAPDASWILCYGCDVSELGTGVEVVWDNGAGIALAKDTE